MNRTLTVKLDRPVKKVTAVSSRPAPGFDANSSQQFNSLRLMEEQKAELDESCSNLKNIVETLADMQSELFLKHKEDIINLAVEIARKILASKIEQGDYKIQNIIKQALDDAPTQKDIVIRLNPDDYAKIEQLTKTSEMSFAKGATFVADAEINPAQCMIETPKGIVESFIEEQLERISEALKRAG